MRFSSAVDALSKENQFLRNVVKILTLTILMLGLTVLFLHDRAPVVVERSSRGLEVVSMTPLSRSEQDIDLSLRLMLKARFDTAAVSPDVYLSKRQLELREAEQREMQSRGLFQSVVFRKAKVSKDEATIEFDRLLSIGDIRSALKTTIKVAFEECEPNELNPYGLKLALATPMEAKEEKR